MTAKQIITAIICIAILCVCGIVLKHGCGPSVEAPKGMRMQPQRLIDAETLETITKPLGEWTCPLCGQKGL